MRFTTLSLAVLASASAALAADPELQIKVTQEVDCDRKTQKGDTIHVHYRGSLASDGSVFDASYNRGEPLSFTVGKGMVIKGWDDGLLDMCIGEKRTLTIPPALGYGSRNMGPIPADSTLIFETELIGIKGVDTPASIKIKTAASTASSAASEAASDAADTASSVAGEASEEAAGVAGKAAEGVKGKIAEKLKDAVEAIEITLMDTDGDGQEHNEL